jgi:hypothetical protein
MMFAARGAAEADSNWPVQVSLRHWSSSLEVKEKKKVRSTPTLLTNEKERRKERLKLDSDGFLDLVDGISTLASADTEPARH